MPYCNRALVGGLATHTESPAGVSATGSASASARGWRANFQEGRTLPGPRAVTLVDYRTYRYTCVRTTHTKFEFSRIFVRVNVVARGLARMN